MKIAEVSEKYGIPQDTLRYYEREGVIPEIKRGNGNIRDYTEDDCKEYEKELQDMTDKRCKELDDLAAKKEKELMAV